MATVRDTSDEAKLGVLRALPSAAERLSIHAADLLTPGSFAEALQGCMSVIHTASPFVMECVPEDAQTRLIDPALRGTRNVLREASRVGGQAVGTKG